MRIIYLCNEHPPAPHGGIGTFVQTLASAMSGAGHEVTVAGLGESAGECYAGDVRVVTLRRSALPRGRGLLDRLRLYHWLRQEVRTCGTDVIETPEFEGYLPLSFAECRVVVRLHQSATAMADAAGRAVPATLRSYERALLGHHRNWIGVSRFALRITQRTFRLTPNRDSVIYPPVTLPPSASTVLPPPDDYLLYAGTVAPGKGVYILAETARRVLTESPTTHLVLAGKIPSCDAGIADRIRDLAGPAAAARIHFTGPLERASLATYMRGARAFIFPSTLETFGLVTAEAMLAGVPVVVCNCGPNPEFIRDGENGLLAQPNDPDALATAALRILSSPGLARTLGENGRRTVEQEFSVERCLRLSEEFYRSICAEARP